MLLLFCRYSVVALLGCCCLLLLLLGFGRGGGHCCCCCCPAAAAAAARLLLGCGSAAARLRLGCGSAAGAARVGCCCCSAANTWVRILPQNIDSLNYSLNKRLWVRFDFGRAPDSSDIRFLLPDLLPLGWALPGIPEKFLAQNLEFGTCIYILAVPFF